MGLSLSGFIEELGQGAGPPGGEADQDQDDQHQAQGQ